MARPDTHCMGGFSCRRRDDCAHHLSESRDHVVERMCSKGTLDAWVPIAAEGMTTMARLKRGEGLIAVQTMAGRPGGVTAREMGGAERKDMQAAQALLRRYSRDGFLIERKGNEGGVTVCRYWTDAAAAEAHQFDAGYQAKIADRIVEVLGVNGSMSARELATAIGWHLSTTHTEAKTLVLLGRIWCCDELGPTNMIQRRFFGTEQGMKDWLAIPGNRVAERVAAREGDPKAAAAAAERARYARKKAERLGLPIPERAQNAPGARQSAKQAGIDTVRANEVSAALQAKAAARKLANTPPAHLPGEPLITKATKITRVPAPPGRFESRDRVIGGFATKRIGEYEPGASRWAEAACT